MSSGEDSPVAEAAMNLPPLASPRSRREVLRVVDAYAHFWEQPKFTDGLAGPPFTPADVMDLLQRAAAIVVYVRRHLDGEDSAPKVRVSEGSAHEFLWSISYDPRKQPDRFVRDLVHATFKDSAGYVEDLTEACVAEYIAEIEARSSGKPDATPCRRAKSLSHLLVQHLSKLEEQPNVPEDPQRWQLICSSLEATLDCLRSIESDMAKGTPAAGVDPKSPVTPHGARLSRKKARKLLKRKRKEVEGGSEQTTQKKSSVDAAPQREEQTDPQTKHAHSDGRCAVSTGDPTLSETFKITIGKLHEDVAKRREDVRDLVEASQALPDDPNVSRQLLEKLQKRCLESSEHLMRDMLTLDSLVASTPEEKARRKEQVDAIQSTLESLDVTAERLRQLSQAMRQKEAEIQQDKEAALVRAQEQAEQKARATSEAHRTNDAEVFERKQQEWADQQSQAAKLRKDSAKKLEERLEHIAGLLLRDDAWKTLKLKPRFEVSDQASLYVLRAYVPDMHKEDVLVDLAEDGSQVILRGARVPTRQQTVEMLQQLAAAIREGRMDSTQLLQLSDEQLLLQMGSGRYGTFIQRFALPDDADREGIQAEYERGVLKVIIRKQAMSFDRLFPAPGRHASPFELFQSPYSARRLPRARQPSPTFDSLFW